MPQGHPMRVSSLEHEKKSLCPLKHGRSFVSQKNPQSCIATLSLLVVFVGGGGFVWLVFPPLSVFFSFVSFLSCCIRPAGLTMLFARWGPRVPDRRQRIGRYIDNVQRRPKMLEITGFLCRGGLKILENAAFLCRGGLKMLKNAGFLCRGGLKMLEITGLLCRGGLKMLEITGFLCRGGLKILENAAFLSRGGLKMLEDTGFLCRVGLKMLETTGFLCRGGLKMLEITGFLCRGGLKCWKLQALCRGGLKTLENAGFLCSKGLRILEFVQRRAKNAGN